MSSVNVNVTPLPNHVRLHLASPQVQISQAWPRDRLESWLRTHPLDWAEFPNPAVGQLVRFAAHDDILTVSASATTVYGDGRNSYHSWHMELDLEGMEDRLREALGIPRPCLCQQCPCLTCRLCCQCATAIAGRETALTQWTTVFPHLGELAETLQQLSDHSPSIQSPDDLPPLMDDQDCSMETGQTRRVLKITPRGRGWLLQWMDEAGQLGVTLCPRRPETRPAWHPTDTCQWLWCGERYQITPAHYRLLWG